MKNEKFQFLVEFPDFRLNLRSIYCGVFHSEANCNAQVWTRKRGYKPGGRGLLKAGGTIVTPVGGDVN